MTNNNITTEECLEEIDNILEKTDINFNCLNCNISYHDCNCN